MPLQEEKYFSTNADGTINTTYCFYCYKNGEFIDGCITLEQKMEDCIAIATQAGMPQKKAEDLASSILPSLKRWK